MTASAQSILIVDDEFSLAETLAEILAWEGYAIATAANGRAALSEMEKAVPDLVLLDFMMPVMDGLEMLQAMRQRPGLEHIPVILMTAAHLALPSEHRQYDALLRKPFEVSAVLQLVRELLERRDRVPTGADER
jgi:two-component system, OmpR family, response regulator VicR